MVTQFAETILLFQALRVVLLKGGQARQLDTEPGNRFHYLSKLWLLIRAGLVLFSLVAILGVHEGHCRLIHVSLVDGDG